jgi:modulator of FtsH protease
MLLSFSLLFSAFTAGLAMMLNMPPLGMIVTMVGYFGLLFATTKTGRHDIAEILLKVALKHQKSNQSINQSIN